MLVLADAEREGLVAARLAVCEARASWEWVADLFGALARLVTAQPGFDALVVPAEMLSPAVLGALPLIRRHHHVAVWVLEAGLPREGKNGHGILQPGRGADGGRIGGAFHAALLGGALNFADAWRTVMEQRSAVSEEAPPADRASGQSSAQQHAKPGLNGKMHEAKKETLEVPGVPDLAAPANGGRSAEATAAERSGAETSASDKEDVKVLRDRKKPVALSQGSHYDVELRGSNLTDAELRALLGPEP